MIKTAEYYIAMLGTVDISDREMLVKVVSLAIDETRANALSDGIAEGRQEAFEISARLAYVEQADAERRAEVAEHHRDNDEFKYQRGKFVAARYIGDELTKLASSYLINQNRSPRDHY